MFDHGVTIKGKSLIHQNININKKKTYEKALEYARNHTPITTELLINLSALLMKNTGNEYKTAIGEFSSARGELRLLNVTAGFGGRSYMSYNKVPSKLEEFCRQLNTDRQKAISMSIDELYRVTFDAHYNLVTIHPWADGNGRMARLVMNMLQFEFGLIPAKILKDDQEEYIKSLIATREEEDLNIFRDFMTSMLEKNLSDEINSYIMSIGESEESAALKPMKTRDKIIALLTEDGKQSATTLAKKIGVSAKAIEKQLAKLKADGLIERKGPAKGGEYIIRK